MRTLFFIIALFLVVRSTAQNPAVFANQSPRPPAQPGQERHFYRAPDVIPGTLPEMRDVSYWVGKMSEPDKVVMTVPQILAMNKAFVEKVKHPDRIDTLARRLILAKIDAYPGLFFSKPEGAVPLGAIRDMIAAQVKYMRHTEYGNILGIQYSAGELDKLEGEMNAGGVGALKARTGLLTETVCLRIVPAIGAEYVGQPDKNRTRWDVWNLDVVPVGGVVTILHVSKSGGSLFVLSDNGYGWVPAEKVALADKTAIDQYVGASGFVVCTGDKVPYFGDSECKFASGWFRMGDKLPVAGTARKVLVPVRQANGTLSIQQAWLAPGADVHTGYLPYTRKNVIVQAFKLLDNIYDWTGAWQGRNHATLLRDIFACFGFRLPSCGELISIYNDHTRWLSAKSARDEQYKSALSSEPFITLQICSSGHSNLFLGDYKGTPINYDTHGYNYTDSTGRSLDIRRVCVETIAIPDYFLKQDLTFVELK